MRVQRQLTVLWCPGLFPPLREEPPNIASSRIARLSSVVMVPRFGGTLMLPKLCYRFSNVHYLAQTVRK